MLIARASLEAQEPQALQLSADRTEFLEAVNETALIGRAEMREADLLVTADEFRFKGRQGDNPDTLVATGNVVYTRGPLRILADKVVLHRTNRSFAAERIRLGSFPFYIAGDAAEGTRETITIRKARLSYGEPGPWQPTATADVLKLSGDGKRIESDYAQVGVGNVRPVPFPKFEHNLAEPLWGLTALTAGYRGSLGAFVDGTLHVPFAPGFRAGGDLGYYTDRGILAGPSAVYSSAQNPDRLQGFFRSGYINDYGDKKTDVLGRPIPEDRAFIEWEHRQQLTDDLNLTGQLNWWRDSEVLRDFRPRRFFPVQQPDTFVEANYAADNAHASLFARFAPNSFQLTQQRLPELRADLLPYALPNGFFARGFTSFAVLRERTLSGNPSSALLAAPNATQNDARFAYDPWTTVSPLPAGPAERLQSMRLDSYLALSRPFAPRDWVTLTPVIGARVTHYDRTRGAAIPSGSLMRSLGEVGFDARLRSSGTFAYRNEAWKINGLRHLFTPGLSYRLVPSADRQRGEMPLIDRRVFSTYLQPLGLGDQRNTDDLGDTNTLRLYFENTLQTKDEAGGSRDLVTLNVANDFRFRRRAGERDVSAIHTELAAMPAKWLEFGLYSSFTPQTFTMREFNSGVTIRDGNLWSVRFSNNFLRKNLNDYYTDARVRLNEQFDALAQLRYDQREHRFTEQSYGIVQNLGNTWRISYIASIYSGRRRESNFGFSIQIDTVRF